MQSKESDSPSMCTTVRSTPLIAIESPSCVPLRMVPQRIRRRPRSASITAPTSSIMPVNMPSLAYRSREAGARKGTVVDVGALNVETRPLNDSGVLLERKLRFGAGQPAPFVAKGRGRFRPPDDVGGDHVRAAFSDACQLPQALFQTDD